MKPASLRRIGALSCAVLGVALTIVGALHLPAARPLLRSLGVACPVRDATAAQVESLQARGWSPLANLASAPARPALGGLSLDRTSEDEAVRWSTARTIPCKPIERGYRYLRCRGFSASALGLSAPPVSEMWLSFDPENKLIGVDVYWRGMSSRQVSAVWEQSTAMLRRTLGDPPIAFGDPQPAALAKHAVETARVQYRYSNYLATVTASHMPESGLAVRLQYLSPGTAPVQPPRSWGQGSRARSVEHAPPISPDPLRGRSLAGADDGMIHPIQ